MKWILIFLVITEIFFCGSLFMPIFVKDAEHDKAFFNYIENKTPETESIWNQESARVSNEKMCIRLAFMGILVANSVALVWTFKRIRNGFQQKDRQI